MPRLEKQEEQASLTGIRQRGRPAVLDALRRFLESHREELMEDSIRQDLEWGLTGDE